MSGRRSRWCFRLNRNNLILLIFWYSVFISSVFLYYTHEKHQESHIRRFYNSLFVEEMIRSTSTSVTSASRLTVSTQGTTMYNFTSLRKYWELFQLKNISFQNKSFIAKDVRTKELPVQKQIVTPSVSVTTKQNVTIKPVKPTEAATVEGYERLIDSKKLELRCSQCAVVASSGHLLNSSAGEEIDKYECVIRMNSAPIIGYEKYVGTKTTVRVMGHVNMLWLNQSVALQREILSNVTTKPDKLIVPWLYNIKINKATDKYYNLAKNFSLKYDYKDMYLLDNEKMKYAENTFQKETGLTR
ncbi:alpha-N-acetylgalactosaminide alpha-2,6-sialyltransferase 6-like [Anneissia japonica]|uniref:alpha-N-acetylgalactosaminide alpha-2,6-sialyltransferase 6-like n=1 Tax=Anneissia japonica TaxID=1529436 RepID=UPI00142553EC|nr:alpha-N-acetylgalactosaminide alpha-2,6-sialyltransferase 6-like [Anneissia japonica]XP_033115174.1 alpha-N-acetylgalactosaminide alpha-2,6-sialyltransferase 6-like [Anneissia japonica]XP_033115175.1 alpha-N-acetylgalactosaminide alpha-2,6-sialyltransferase 6-like [Anneissia japonica]XP_033115176.1 alpha-N-acetylgalactosaminide alpha-2,6-sialyltransferase 6-like [Anneissia japonica]XP_033115177.1 alpha-N-acetylgalactosaminide alpha-2,6-sialyltransferase 6-like [Anneissia japonica]